jgi:hypothetical protein
MEKMTDTETLLEALEIGLDAAQDVAAETHARFAGYKPHRHAAVDEAVRKIEAAIASLKAAPAPGEPRAGWNICPRCKRQWKAMPENSPLVQAHRAIQPAPAAPAPSDLMTPHTMAGFRGGFISLHRRTPTEQEIWNAGVRSGIDRTAPAPAPSAPSGHNPVSQEELKAILDNGIAAARRKS